MRAPSILFFSGLLAAWACAPKPVPPADPPPALDGTAWVLTALGGQPAGAPAPTVRFEAGKAQGSDGCNRYSVPLTTNGAAIEVSGQGISTQMACEPEVMERAAAFTRAMGMARSYRVANGSLELVGQDGAVLATFTPQSQSLAGTWEVVGVNNGKGGVVSIATDQVITLEFAEDGRVAGSAGCNRYTGTFTTEGEKVTFGPAAATRKMCPDAKVMEQEQNFLTALGTVSTVQVEGDRAHFRAADGAIALSAVKR